MLDLDPTAYDGWLGWRKILWLQAMSMPLASGPAGADVATGSGGKLSHVRTISREQLRWSDAVTFFRSGLDKKTP
ncbi:MAG: hypothetical protein Ct9H300mP13_5640 [Gammaproteobacteria bacterium]|nr:MAG: hypothetical protein Ct9H300mP13_5640 [Gammaproteobacteria bacterium]